jgi:hypothetical protein
VLVESQTFRPDRLLIWQRSAWPLTRRASDDARRPLPARKSGERLRGRFASISDSSIQTATPSHSRGAMRPRFASPSRTQARGWSGGRRQDACEAPLEAGGEPTSHGKAPCAPKARRSASQRSTGHQAVDRSGAPRSGQLSLCPLQGSLLESNPSPNRTRNIYSSIGMASIGIFRFHKIFCHDPEVS